MKILQKITGGVVASTQSAIIITLICHFGLILANTESALAQKKEKVVIKQGASVETGTYTSIPEATEPCTAEEAEWWKQIRQASADIFMGYKKSKKKAILEARARYFLLLYEGQQKSYHVPLKDRPPQLLLFGKATYPYIALKNKIEGAVKLLVEFRADGLIGDIQNLKDLGWGLDENATQAVRQMVFLPAIKNGAFVTYRDKVECVFDLPGGATYTPSKPQ